MQRKGRATIKQVADLADVSTATVSYVLNNTVPVTAETRDKVLRAVSRLNYKTNAVARALRTNKSHTVGVFVEDITVFNAAPIIDGINERLEAYGYHIIVSNLRLDTRIANDFSRVSEVQEEIDENLAVLFARQIDGLIYLGEHTRDVTGTIKRSDVPTVYTYCYTTNQQDYFVNYNDRLAACEVVRYLHDLGHRRIGLIAGPPDSGPASQRLTGFREALDELGEDQDQDLITHGDWSFESGYEGARALLHGVPAARAMLPTALFALNDLMAVGAIEAAFELGFRVPEDLSVVGFDNREFSFFHRPKLTTVDLPLAEMGRKAAETLMALINGERVATHVWELPCRLVKRKSVSAVNTADRKGL